MTYEQLLQEYLFARHLRPASEDSYSRIFNILIQAIGGVSPDELERSQILTWRRQRLASGLSITSWNSYMRHFKAVFRFGIEQGYLQRTHNPFDGLSLPPVRRRKKTLEGNQVVAVIQEFEQLGDLEEQGLLSQENAGRIGPVWFWRTVFETLYHTGIRRNQLLHLRAQDVDFSRRMLHIRLEGSKTHREYEVPINEALLPWLTKLARRAQGVGIEAKDQLFNITRFDIQRAGRYRNQEMNGEHISRCFTDLSKRVGFKVSPHRLRHTLGTNLMRDSQANVHLVKALMGHTNLSTTLQYVEPDMEAMRELLDRRSQSMRSGGERITNL